MRRDIARGTTDITRAKMWAYHAGHAFGHYVLFPLLFDIRVRGLEHVPPDGPCILAANHVSNFDPLLVGSYIPRTTTFVAKQELYKATILALLWYLWGAVKVRRDGMDMRPLRMLLRILADGGTVCMFPEGTRSRGRGCSRRCGARRTWPSRAAPRSCPWPFRARKPSTSNPGCFMAAPAST